MLEQEVEQAFRPAPYVHRAAKDTKEGYVVAVINREDKSEVRASIETVNKKAALMIRVWVPGFDDITLRPVSWMAVGADEIPLLLQAVTAASACLERRRPWPPLIHIRPTPSGALAPCHTPQEAR